MGMLMSPCGRLPLRACALCVIFTFSSIAAFGQYTAPRSVDLSYHFRAGTVLNYERDDQSRNPDGAPGYAGGNWELKEDVHITVEKVDLDGSATLVVQNVEMHDFKGGSDANSTGGPVSVQLAE